MATTKIHSNILSSLLCCILLILIECGSCTCGQKMESAPGQEGPLSLKGVKGKVTVVAPDSLRVFKSGRITVRIAKLDLQNEVFLEKIKYDHSQTSIDTIKLSSVMKVTLKETLNEDKLKILMLNNSDYQVVDTANYSEWIFEITPHKYGLINLTVAISAMVKTEFGNYEEGFPVLDKNITIYALPADKLHVFLESYSTILIIALIFIFGLIIKLIPKQIIIEHFMPNSKRTNFWNAGALGLLIYLITIISIVIFKIIDVSLYYAVLVLIATVLIYTVFTAVSLRDSGKLTQKNFLELMSIALKKIPPLNFFFRNEEPEKKPGKPSKK